MDSLPLEILTKILLNLPPNPSDRLVCHAFKDILTPACFRRIRTWEFTKDAFDRLVNLSQSGLSRYVRDYEYLVHPPVYLPSIHAVDNLICLEHTYPTDDQPLDVIADDLVQRHEEYLHQEDILGTFYDVLSLSKAFPLFRNLRSVTVSRSDATDDAPWTYENTMERAWWAVIKALNKCDYPIERLHVDAVYNSMLYGVAMSKMAQVYEVLGELKELSVPVISLGNEVLHLPVHAALKAFLRSGRNLEVVRLGNYNRLRMDLVDKDLGHIWPSLRVLDLVANAAVEPGDLVAFLELHSVTLRELTLRRFGLVGRVESGTHWVWERIFERLHKSLTLTKLSLSDLQAPSGSPAVTIADMRGWERTVPRPPDEMAMDRD
ncbi:hypothetical protein L873DRAFT_841227 [Choiromyces venosus 120613-1]|uniref:F-box domain-containing protein n=1 Tax=Choiromyces venosus 120613-1 TaxID=1336337 RepID=A0A3N4JNX9_9PEZI|nr:hypothetical protein L873DRAFT_841227 [Choiromyces venosus 120613-1]